MPKIKISKSSPSLDMTPMVDLGFLLVTFFMLTSSSFRQAEPVLVDTPQSISSEVTLPENTMLITLDTAGRVFFDVNGHDVRANTLRRMANFYNVKFSDDQIEKYARMKSIGVPIKELPEYLDRDELGRKKLDKETKGVPVDTFLVNPTKENELRLWINFARVEEKTYADAHAADNHLGHTKMQFAIKADGLTAYKKVKDIINIFQNQDIYTFQLITSLKKSEEAAIGK